MRISDWSSDVCSSDLAAGRRTGAGGGARGVLPRQGPAGGAGEAPRQLARRAARARGTAGRGHHRGPADGAQPRRADNALRGTTMSIERSQSPTQPDAARDVGRDKADTRPREPAPPEKVDDFRSEEHTSELQSLMRISSA